MKQCQALTVASTYSRAHRCLKTHGTKIVGKRRLCAHHGAMAARTKSTAAA